MRHFWMSLAVIAIIMTAVPGASAQVPSPHVRTTYHGPTQVFGFGPAGTIISAKAHAPFSAVLVEHMEETLSDGTKITRENEEVVMRDGTGRIYRARKIIKAAEASERNASPRTLITITDPVQHVQYVCTPIKICRKMGYKAWPDGRGPRPGPGPGLLPGRDRNVTEEDLGTTDISGLRVVGKRVTRVIPEGMVGNDRPFTTVEELWHSEELDIDVQAKRTDPRLGTRTRMMTEVNLEEPNPNYFQVPEGYRVVEEGKMPPQPQAEPMLPQNQ